MDPMEGLLAERACERLILDFVHRLDLGEPSSVAELCTEDGGGGRTTGGWSRAATRCAHTSAPVRPTGSPAA